MKATTRDLDPAEPVDLVAFAGDHDDGILWLQGDGGLATRGCALRLELPNGFADPDAPRRIGDALASIETDDAVARPATGPVALGALPFDAHEPCHLVVPEVLVGRSREGRQWLTTIDGAPAHLDTPPQAARPSPDNFRLTSPRSHDAFRQLVRDAVKAVDSGELDKVVIAREVIVDTDRAISMASVVERLHALYPSCTVFSIDGFVGASPELLIERRGARLRTFPLAGTFARSGDAEADAVQAARLQSSRKDRDEHQYVIDGLCTALTPRCIELHVPDRPAVIPLRNVLHLGTEITGALRAPAATAFELVAALHPTPAVGGTPTPAALQWLCDNEPLDRGHYAGPVGWTDRNGDGSFVVGIRSAEVAASRRRARLFAGVGIVAGSEPEAELVETQLKLQALLAALVRP